MNAIPEKSLEQARYSGAEPVHGTPTIVVDPAIAAPKPFSGSPDLYRKFAWGGSIAIHAYLYAGFLFFHGHLGGAQWVFGWKPAAIAVASCLLFGRFAFRWIMRLDAQYGQGSGWQLDAKTVKLPEPRRRK